MLVLDALASMGADKHVLRGEFKRLRTDRAYYHQWCGLLDHWYPGWKRELMRMRLGIAKHADAEVE